MEQLWEKALGILKAHLSAENFETWLEPVQFGGIESDSIVLKIPNQFFAEWIAAHYLDLILETLQAEAGETRVPKKVRWELDETLREKAQAARETTPPPAPRPPRATPKPPDSADLNPKYRFRISSSALPTNSRMPQAWPVAPTPDVATTRSSSTEASASARRT